MNQMVQTWQLLTQQQQAGLLPHIDVKSAFMQALHTHDNHAGPGFVSPYPSVYGLTSSHAAEQYHLENQDAPTVLGDDSWMEYPEQEEENQEDDDF